MRNALLLLLMSLGGSPNAAPPDAAPATAPAGLVMTAAPEAARRDVLPGRWCGEWAVHDGPPRPVTVVFARHAGDDALLANVTVGALGRPRTVHRRALVNGTTVRVAMPDGSEARLRLVDGDRLVGEASRASLKLARASG